MAEEITREIFLKEWLETKKKVVDYMDGQKTLLETMEISRKDLGAIYKNAYDAFTVENYEEAENLFLSLLLWNFKDPTFQTALAAVYEAQEKFENALSMYSLAMMMDRQTPELLFRTGKCLLAMGQKNEATIMFELAAESEAGGDKINFAVLGTIEKSKNILKLLKD